MTIKKSITACSLLLLLGVGIGCADVAASTVRITNECLASGMFKMVSGTLLSAIPGGPIGSTLINAGVDQVCMDPARFAQTEANAAATAGWVASNIKGALHQ